jgi:hypothetical protein
MVGATARERAARWRRGARRTLVVVALAAPATGTTTAPGPGGVAGTAAATLLAPYVHCHDEGAYLDHSLRRCNGDDASLSAAGAPEHAATTRSAALRSGPAAPR